MKKIVRNMDNMFGMGFATIKLDSETGMYQGFCSNGNSTAKYEQLSDCIRKMNEMGYK